jgi:hypothetical protein
MKNKSKKNIPLLLSSPVLVVLQNCVSCLVLCNFFFLGCNVPPTHGKQVCGEASHTLLACLPQLQP